jgi:xyloglucan-specific exo-beta-1,4-glucanase
MKKQLLAFRSFIAITLVFSSFLANSQTPFNWKSVNIQGMGYVTGMVIHPNTTLAPNLVYVRTDVGGSYRFNNQNQSWIPLGDMNTMATKSAQNIESIAIDPKDINKLYIAVDVPGKGDILVSNNQGASWTSTGFLSTNTAISGNSYFRGASGEKLMLDPNNSNILFYGSRSNGLWTKNGTSAWTKITNGLPNNPAIPGYSFVIVDKNSAVNGVSQTIYVGIYGAGIYRSTDGAKTFSSISSNNNPLRATISSNGALFVTFGGNEDSYQGPGAVAKFSNNSWTDITPNGNKATSYTGISIDPTDANKVVVATQNRLIYRSTNAGSNWTKINFKLGAYPAYYTGQEATWGSAALVIDPNNTSRVWNTDGYGVARTQDIWAGTVVFDYVMNNLEELCTTNITTFPEYGYADLISLHWDMFGFRNESRDVVPSIQITNFDYIARGEGLDFCFSKPNYVAFVGRNEVDDKIGYTGYSTDNGKTWTKFNTSTASGVGGKVAISSSNEKNIVWVANGQTSVPKYSFDAGQTWSNCNGISGPWPNSSWYPMQYLVSDKVNGNTFYYYDNGTVYYSNNGGKDWAKGASNLPSYKGGPHLKVHPYKEGEIWFTGWSWDGNPTIKAYKSTDGGKTFVEQTNTQYAFAIAFGRGEVYHKPYMYLSGKVGNGPEGVYRSTDEGNNWSLISDPTQLQLAMLLEGDLRYKNLVYATPASCRGAIYGSLNTPDLIQKDTALMIANAPAIDGALQESYWDMLNSKKITRLSSLPNSNPSNSFANLQTRYDDNNLYVAIAVNDASLFSGNADAWNNSGVELYLDMGNNRTLKYDENDYQYFFQYNKTQVVESKNRISGVVYKSLKSSLGYTLEISIPWATLGAKPVKDIGFDIAINLNQQNAPNRTGQLMWNGTDMNWNETSQYAYLHLSTSGVITDLNNPELSTSTRVFPNPFAQTLYLEKSQKWTLYNSMGQLIKQGDSAQIEGSNLNKGVYLILLENGTIQKLVKE